MSKPIPSSPYSHASLAGMRILVLCHEYPPVGGGAAAVCAALTSEYRRLGAEPVVLTMAFGGLPREETIDGVPVFRVECGRRQKEMASPLEGLRWAARCQRLVKQLHAQRPFDATHAHFIMPAGIVASRLKWTSGVPFIITLHGSDVPGYNRERLKLVHTIVRPWWRRICRHADRVVSPSACLLRSIEPNAPGVRGQVIPNGFVPGRFQPLEKQQRILLCSRMVERKGFQYFLEAIADLSLPDWSVDIVGDGPMRPRLEVLAAKCSTPVRFHGWIDNTDPRLAELFGRAMIFAFPSEWENFSIALLEAMSAGCAVVTTDIAGNPEAIGDTGYLTAPRDIAGLREAIVALTSDPARCHALAEAAHRRATSQFAWSTIAAQYTQLLQRPSMARAA